MITRGPEPTMDQKMILRVSRDSRSAQKPLIKKMSLRVSRFCVT